MKTKVLILLALSSLTLCAQDKPTLAQYGPVAPALYETAMRAAWTNFQSGEYETAITNAETCIAAFGQGANQIQSVREKEKTIFPVGKVSKADKERITRDQILHDVATCFLIKGWAEEKLGHKEEARKAYTEARKYPLARSSMPTGESFWSPAEKASESLAKLQ